MKQNKIAFTFVELIISVAILILLGVIAITTLNKSTQKTNNTKIEAGTITLKNAFLSYLEENKTLPQPNGNNNYFKGDSTYAHSGSTDAFGVYGSVTEKTLPKKYIDNLPLDPVSNHYYSYGKTINNKYFEIASIIRKNEKSYTKLDGNYPGEYGPISLIREFNGGYFVSDKSTTHLPYNPYEHILTAKDQNGKIYYAGSKITNNPQALTLYFSDGSVSVLGTGSTLTFSELDFKTPENNLLTQIKLFLSAGEIFTKATALNTDSDFEIYTADTTAAVRGTIFSVSYNETEKTEISVIKGIVKVQEKENTINNLNPIDENSQDTKELKEGEIIKSKSYDGCFIDEKLAELNFSTVINQLSNILTGGGPSCSTITIDKFTKKEFSDRIKKEIKNKIKIADRRLLNINNIPKGKKISEVRAGEDFGKKGYKLYASANYNTDGDISLYHEEGEELTSTGTFSTTGGYLNASGNGKYLKYSSLDLGDNFAIEMRVKGQDLMRNNDNHNLFNTNKATYLKINDENNCSGLDETKFYKVIAIINNSNINIKVINKDGGNETSKCKFLSGAETSNNTLYIGSNKPNSSGDYSSQWNGIIDYVKIYK